MSLHLLTALAFLPALLWGCPTDEHLQDFSKRWNAATSNGKISNVLWDDATITYCFSDSASYDALADDLNAAWQLWITANLPAAKFTFKLGNPPICSTATADYLQVRLNNGRGHSSTVGKSSQNVMSLDASTTAPTGNSATNYAHEIGHAWGLLHEHQRKDLWTSPYGGNAQNNYFYWTCNNLADYSRYAATFTSYEMQRLCMLQSYAETKGFTASNFLPVADSAYGGTYDQNSIMLYGSTAGGTTLSGGGRAVVLAKNNAAYDTWGYNMAPSATDVSNLKSMYKVSIKQKLSALFSNSNNRQALFYQIASANFQCSFS